MIYVQSSWVITIKFACVIVSALFLWGCQDSALEATPYGQTTSEDFFQNAGDAKSAINAAYEPMYNEDYYGHAEHTFSIPSDDQYRAGDHGEDAAIENLTFGPSNPQLGFSWTLKYEAINRSNDVLANVPDISMKKSLKDRILGEAYFLRAFNYWRFMVVYGSVPLILEKETQNSNFNQPRPPLQEFRSQIESDLKKAANLLPLEHGGSNKGRPTKGSAWGLLTKLYVYQERWQDAIEMGKKVINGPYPLSENFTDNFQSEAQNIPEVLWGVYAEQGWNGQTHTIYTTPRPWGGWDFHAPTQDLVNEFEKGDPRREYTIMEPGDKFNLGGNQGMTEYKASLSPTTGYHFEKYADWREGGGVNTSMDIPILRAADVYLLVAEAKIRSGGNGDEEINAVRQRVGLSKVSNATMEDLIHERRVELAGENQRWYDLLRWDKAGIINLKDTLAMDQGPYNPSTEFIRPKHYYYAIPQRQIDLSNGKLKQNPGYSSGSEPCMKCVDTGSR